MVLPEKEITMVDKAEGAMMPATAVEEELILQVEFLGSRLKKTAEEVTMGLGLKSLTLI